MMLQALIAYAERENLGDPDFETVGVRWLIPLDSSGRLAGSPIALAENPDEKKLKPKQLRRPFTSPNELNQGDKSHFLCDSLERAALFLNEKSPQARRVQHGYFKWLLTEAAGACSGDGPNRNYVYLAKAKPNGKGELLPAAGYDLHVKQGTVLNDNIRKACDDTGLRRREDEKADKEKAKNRPREEIGQLQAWLCQKFYDVRAFGSVLSTGPNAGQLRGPVQISFARSIDPVLSLDIFITRICGTDEQKATEMGRKAAIPYGLYRCHGFVSAHLAQQTKFTEDDLKVLFFALCGRAREDGEFQPSMMDSDVSAARRLTPQKLVVFKHDSMLGNAPAHKLFERVVVPKVGVARSFDDYKPKINIDRANLPGQVRLLELL